MHHRHLGVILALACSVLAAAPLAAQKPVQNRVALPTAATAAPTFAQLTTAPVTLQLAPVSDALALEPQARVRVRHRAPGVTLMLVGAAGVITGLIIDESLVTIPSAAVGV